MTEEYENHYIKYLPDYFKHHVSTYYIPITPVYKNKIQRANRRNPLGIAFNSVKYDTPAPFHAILAKHTIASLDYKGGHKTNILDECGGHENQTRAYH